MTTAQAIFFGIMIAWTPSLIVLLILLWRARIVPDREPPAPPSDNYKAFLRVFGGEQK